jgi:hypothetical protein
MLNDKKNQDRVSKMTDRDLVVAAQEAQQAEKQARDAKERLYGELRRRAGEGGKAFAGPDVISNVGKAAPPISYINIEAVKERYTHEELESMGFTRDVIRAQRVFFVVVEGVVEIRTVADEDVGGGDL